MKHTLAMFALAVSLGASGFATAATGDLSDADDATQYNWTTSGTADWSFQTATTHDGIDAARSGTVGNNGSSQMEVEVNGPGTLTFWWKVDSQVDDTLSVFAEGDGNPQGISGTGAWTQVTLDIGPGPQTVTWNYTKDASGSAGEDAGWVDQVHFTAETDAELPTLQYIAISPDPASVAAGPVDVTVTFEISDDNRGVEGGFIDLFDAVGNNATGSSFDSSNRVSGDANSGTYAVTFTIDQSDLAPAGSNQQGIWRAAVYIEEKTTLDSRAYGEFDDEFPIPGDEIFTVTGGSSGELGLLSIDLISPNPVNITTASRTVTLNFTLDDLYQEFDHGFVNLRDSNNQYVNGFYFDTTNGSGNQHSVSLILPRYGPSGVWSVDFSLYDHSDNPTYVSGTVHIPGDNLFDVVNTGIVDSSPPVLTSISITPGTINTTSAAANLTLTAAISDNLVGIDYAFIDFYDSDGFLVESLRKFVDDNQITGGSFSVVQTIPQGSLSGLWRCEVTTRDLLGNTRKYGTGTGVNEVPFPVPANAQFTISTVPVATYAEFTTHYLLFGSDALPASNPDSDWANNALELLLGLDPTVATAPDPALYQAGRVGNDVRLDFKVASGLTVTADGSFLEITKSANSPPFKVTGQTASNLAGPWSDTLPISQGGGIYRVSLPVGAGVRGFCRLRFVDP